MSDWEEIHGFESPNEYRRFLSWIDDQIQNGNLIEIAVRETYGSPYFEERWFESKVSGETWRVVAPEVPFRGVFLKV